ncbi:MAG: VOC family protein [Cellulomonas sp.]
MGLEWEHVIVHTAQPVELGRWWAKALGWSVVWQSVDEYSIRRAPERLPGLTFVMGPDAKVAKNRLHLDFHPDNQAAEVDRLVHLGARRVDIGQGEPRSTGECGVLSGS